MRTAAAATIVALAAAATSANAQSVNWSWTVSDTGNANGVIEPGEQGIFSLSAQIVGAAPGAHLGNAIFNVMNLGGLETGTFTSLTRNGALSFNPLGNGTADPLGNINGVDAFQLGFMLNPAASLDNPIHVFTAQWAPTDYTPRSVTGGSVHLLTSIYSDMFAVAATDVPSVGGVVTAQIVPAPGAVALLGLAGLTAARRRRS